MANFIEMGFRPWEEITAIPNRVRQENGTFEIKMRNTMKYNNENGYQLIQDREIIITGQGTLFYFPENKICQGGSYSLDLSYDYDVYDSMTNDFVETRRSINIYQSNFTYLYIAYNGNAEITFSDGRTAIEYDSHFGVFYINSSATDQGNGGHGPVATYQCNVDTQYLKFNGVDLIGICTGTPDTGCPCPDIQNMINAANKELYDAFVQWNGNRRTAKIELVKTLTEAMSKGNQDKFEKLSKEISDLQDKIWGG